MQRTGNFPLRSSDLEIKPGFNVVIAYEDFETGKHARRTYDYLAQHLGEDCQFTNEMWKFDVLGIPRLRELAAKDVARADIVIIACHGGGPLPDSVKAWIESWLAEEVNAIALVALFDSKNDRSPETQRIREYLAEVARRANMEFFAQPDRWPDRTQPAGLVQFLPSPPNLEHNFSTPPLDYGSRKETFPHWGINE